MGGVLPSACFGEHGRRYHHGLLTRRLHLGDAFKCRGTEQGAHCSVHAKTGMVDVHNKRCSHSSCLKRPSWGVVTDGKASTCGPHKSDILGTPVVDFEAKWVVASCNKKTGWEFDGKQPTHCFDHGPIQEGLILNFRTDRSPVSYFRSPSYRLVRSPSLRIKNESMF